MLAALLAGTPSFAHAQPAPPPSSLRVEVMVRLLRVAGHVEVSPSEGAPFAPAVADTLLGRGARLRTADDGRAYVAWAGGLTLALDPQSLLTLFGNSAPTVPGVPAVTTTTLHRGVLHLVAPRENAAATTRTDLTPVGTSTLTVFPGRADATVAAELGGHITRVSVTRGRVRVRFGAAEYLVPTQFAVREEAGRPPALLRLLPRAPEWRRAPSTRAVSFGEPVAVEGSFGPSRRAATGLPVVGWRLEVARDESFHDLVTEERLGPQASRVRIPSLAPGVWFARLFAFDAERFESAASTTARIEIAAPHVEAGVEPTATQPGRRAALVIPTGFWCGVDGGPLVTAGRPMLLDPGRRYALRCGTSADGADARDTILDASRVGPLLHTLRLGTAVASTDGVTVSGTLAVSLRDAEGRTLSLAAIDVAGDPGVTADPMRETDVRGTYGAGLRYPRGLRTARLRFTVNHAAVFEETVELPQPTAATIAPAPRPPAPAAVQVQVIRSATPFHRPEDDEPPPEEE